jgi:arylsulfatase A-like enzyme
MADDLGWADLGFQDHPVLQTPHLDAMARRGMRFNRFYAAAPVCSPTRGSVLTGRHPFRYGIFNANSGHLPKAEITLAELLRSAGYTTGFFGKWHLGTLTTRQKDSNRGGPDGADHFEPPLEHGFDQSFSTEAKVPTYDPMTKPHGVERTTWWNPVTDEEEADVYGTAYWLHDGERETVNLEGDDSRIIMDRAIPFIRGAVESGRPFLAVIWFHAPHLPVVSDSTARTPYRDLEPYAQHYFGCISALDDQIGRLRASLVELGVANKTMLWFNSDNGPEGFAGEAPGSAGSLRGRKRSLFEGGIRVPGIVEWPEHVPPGSETDEPIVTSDILPTVIDVLGLSLPDKRPLDGISILPLLKGKPWARPAPIAFHSHGQMALSGRRFKLIHVPGYAPTAAIPGLAPSDSGPLPTVDRPYMLFDLHSDPAEMHDLASEKPDLVSSMRLDLENWRTMVDSSRAGLDYLANPH